MLRPRNKVVIAHRLAAAGAVLLLCSAFPARAQVNAPTLDDRDGFYDYTLAQAESTFSGVSGNLEVDPLFVNAGGLDFRLRSGSPAIDAGLAISGVTCLGAAPDLGAHEAR